MTIWTTAEIIDFSFNLWLINCALMRVMRGKRELGLGANPNPADRSRNLGGHARAAS